MILNLFFNLYAKIDFLLTLTTKKYKQLLISQERCVNSSSYATYEHSIAPHLHPNQLKTFVLTQKDNLIIDLNT